MNIQIGKTKPIEYENTRIDKTRKPKTILSLADRLLLKLLLNNTSRMTGDCHVWFCERLRGETPLDLLGEKIFCYTKSHEEESKLLEERVVQHARQAGGFNPRTSLNIDNTAATCPPLCFGRRGYGEFF